MSEAKSTEFKVGDFVGFTVPKNRWEAKNKRRGNITAIIDEGRALVDCSGEIFTVQFAKMEKL